MYIATEQIQGWFDNVKIKAEELLNKLDLSPSRLAELGVFLGIGFLIGFFIKKFGRPVIIVFAFMIVGLIVLQYGGVIIIDWVKVKGFLGIAPTEQLNEVAQSWYSWAKSHLIVVVGSVVGFLLGYSIG